MFNRGLRPAFTGDRTMTQRIDVSVDVCSDSPISDVLETIGKYQGKIEDFVVIGPGGGNPCLRLSFPDQQSADDFEREWEDGNEYGVGKFEYQAFFCQRQETTALVTLKLRANSPEEAKKKAEQLRIELEGTNGDEGIDYHLGRKILWSSDEWLQQVRLETLTAMGPNGQHSETIYNADDERLELVEAPREALSVSGILRGALDGSFTLGEIREFIKSQTASLLTSASIRDLQQVLRLRFMLREPADKWIEAPDHLTLQTFRLLCITGDAKVVLDLDDGSGVPPLLQLLP